MTCSEAIKCIEDFTQNRLSGSEKIEFVKHIQSCPSCYEELETYYTIALTLQYLDEDDEDAYDVPRHIDRLIAKEQRRVTLIGLYYRFISVFIAVLLVLLVILTIYALSHVGIFQLFLITLKRSIPFLN